MKTVLSLILSMQFTISALAGDAPPDPEQWYRDSYAPLFADKPGENVDALLDHYADVVTTHSADGAPTQTNKQEWLAEPMAEWFAEGWLTSELVGLQTDRVNASTTVFKAKWLDTYQGGATEHACGWYLADFFDGKWQFTQYADLDCEQQKL